MYVDSRILVVLPIGECTTDGMDEYMAARKDYFVEIERLTLKPKFGLFWLILAYLGLCKNPCFIKAI